MYRYLDNQKYYNHFNKYETDFFFHFHMFGNLKGFRKINAYRILPMYFPLFNYC